MKKSLVFLMVLLSVNLFAEIKVAEQEIQVKKKIVFTNYRGVIQKSDKVEDIFNIGYYLAEHRSPDYAQLRNKYSIRRVLSTNQLLLSADVFSILPDAKVNHIKNVRRVLSAYLEKSFEYSKKTANNVALFVIYYNALHRGDSDYLKLKYAPEVLSSVSMAKVGITANYKTWPGNTEILIPISISDLYGKNLGNRELYKEATKVLGKQPDKGIDKRSQMLETRKKEIAKKESKLQTEKSKVNKKLDRVGKDIEKIKSETPSDERRQKLENADKKQNALNEDKTKLDKEEQKLKKEREGLKEDSAKLEEDKATVNYSGVENSKFLYFLKDSKKGLVRQLNSIDKENLTVSRTKNNVSSQNIGILDSDTVVAVYNSDKGIAKLTAFDGETFDILAQSKNTVYSQSKIMTDSGFAYAVVGTKSFNLGKFDASMKLKIQSKIKVLPETDIIISKDYIFVTSTNGIVALNKDTLKLVKDVK